MKVLYALWNYPQLSETYIATEIAYAQSRGVEVQVWSEHLQKTGIPEQCPVHRGTLAQAVAAADPDVVHVHYLVMAERICRQLPGDLPVTVRAHSFDWAPQACEAVARISQVRRIFAFPHFARSCLHPKVQALPVAYSSARFQPSPWKNRRMVLRLAAALPSKGLSDFFAAAAVLPAHRFVLGVARAGGAEDYPALLQQMARGSSVDLRFDLSWDEAAALTAEAGIYMDTSDPNGHAFGMPISIAEAMATGAAVLARKSTAAEEYLGSRGVVYDSVEQAASWIRHTMAWSDGQCAESRTESIRCAKAFQDLEVLPVLIEEWDRLAHPIR